MNSTLLINRQNKRTEIEIELTPRTTDEVNLLHEAFHELGKGKKLLLRASCGVGVITLKFEH